jgi:hypothetical protein
MMFSDLSHAGLQNANLESVALRSATLESALLCGANLSGTHLFDAKLAETDLRRTNLQRAYLNGARFGKTRFIGHNLGNSVGEELAARGRLRSQFERFITYADARDVYLDPKANLSSIGYYDEASWACMKERRMEKPMYVPTTIGRRSIEMLARSLLQRGLRKFPLRFVRRHPSKPKILSLVPRSCLLVLSLRLHLQIFLGLVRKDLKHQTCHILVRPVSRPLALDTQLLIRLLDGIWGAASEACCFWRHIDVRLLSRLRYHWGS